MKALIPSKVAEIIFALIIGYFGVGHFMNADSMASWVPPYMPGGGKLWIYITGAGLVLSAIAIITGMMKTLACYLLAAMLLIFVVTKHLPGAINSQDEMVKMSSMSNLLKDAAMAMFAILIGNGSAKS